MSEPIKNNGKASKILVPGTLDAEQRRHKRYRTQSLRIDNPVAGRVVNVGEIGFALETPQGLSVGKAYHFTIRLGDRQLRLTGHIRWCRLTSTRSNGGSESLPVYKAGIALAETVAGKAWQEALRRLTEEPVHRSWYRVRLRSEHRPFG